MMKDYSNYHDTDVKAKIERDGMFILEQSLDGYAGYDVLINNIESKILMYQKYDSNGESMKVIGRTEDIERGNVIKYNNEYWLVLTKPEDNRMYRKAEIELCNNEFPINSNTTRVLIGHDDRGRPIYDDEIVNEFVPCIVESRYTRSNESNNFMIPDGNIIISLQLQPDTNAMINYEFVMYGKRYQIMDVNLTSTVNDKGIMILTAQEVVV